MDWKILAAIPLLVACGSDPSWIPPSPGAHDSNSAPAAPAHPVADAGHDADPGYRDPKQIDGGCALPNLVCGGACVPVGSDHDNCGACGAACLGGDSTCIAGKCACSGPLTDYCDGTGCMDVSADTSNCGSCGNVCDPSVYDICLNGMCANSNN